MLARRLSILLCAVVFAACSSGSNTSTQSPGSKERPASNAKLTISVPRNGQTVKGPQVHVEVALQGAKIIDQTTTNLRPDEGHVHVKLDGQLQSQTAGTSFNLEDVKPGSHVLQVEFVASDHAPFDPRVVAGASFVVT